MHCLCRRPNNEDRPMICCDDCNGWFHYDCVGLPLPHKAESAPREFCCPVCSAKVSCLVCGTASGGQQGGCALLAGCPGMHCILQGV